jgi:hypothetical protein
LPGEAMIWQQDAKKSPKNIDGHLILLRSTASSLLDFIGCVSNLLVGFGYTMFQSGEK